MADSNSTKSALADAMKKLMVRKSFAKISISDLCEECGLKPYSQKNFVQQITAAFPDVTRDIDRMAKRRILTGIRLGEVLG